MASLRKKGVLSIWVGMEKLPKGVDILRDFCGVEYYDIDSQECIPDEIGKSRLVESLIRQLSYSVSFAESAIAKAKEMGIDEAGYVLAQYDFKYDPYDAVVGHAGAPIFLGHFNWTFDAGELKAIYG